MQSCESYIVRIYRREPENPERITGLVEVIETGEKKKFASGDELREIFSARNMTKKRDPRAEKR